VSAKGARFFYVPDVAGLPDAPNTLRGISVYIGDGATMTRSMVRKKNGTLIGHAPMTVQLSWCKMAVFAAPFSPIADRRSYAAMRAF